MQRCLTHSSRSGRDAEVNANAEAMETIGAGSASEDAPPAPIVSKSA